MKISKVKILKTLDSKCEAIIDALDRFSDYLETLEDPRISSMGEELVSALIDILYDDNNYSVNEIRAYIEEELD